jgi:hypothetical protein
MQKFEPISFLTVEIESILNDLFLLIEEQKAINKAVDEKMEELAKKIIEGKPF